MNIANNLISSPFYLGNWLVNPAKNTIQKNSELKNIQPKLMEVLTFMCLQGNKIVSADSMIQNCWSNQYMSDNPVHKCIAQLRKALGDSSKNPKYIGTIPKRGYSILAKVTNINLEQQSIEPYWLDSTPFAGLQPYSYKQKDIFFGRKRVINSLIKIINSKDKDNDTKLILLLGQSGCGKTSLVQAGILPKLLQPYKPFNINYKKAYTYTIKLNEFQKVEKSLLAFLYVNEILSNDIELNHYYDYINENPNQILPYINIGTTIKEPNGVRKKRIIIFIDQLENIFTNKATELSTTNFFKIIELLLESQKCLIISAIRNEYYREITELDTYISIRANVLHYDIPSINYDEISEIVKKPAQASGLLFEVNKETGIALDTYLINKAQAINVSLSILQ